MATSRFDSWCKNLAGAASRRELLRLAAAGLVGIVAAPFTAAATGAQTAAALPCGDAGLFCCGSGSPCNPGLTCSNGICTFVSNPPCGDEYQACCTGAICAATLRCVQETCVACGGMDQLCCAGNLCKAGFTCDGEICQ